MRWEDLLFLHWPVDPDLIRPHLPDDLELDTFDGKAWLGVVPFMMAGTRFRWLPPAPTASRFPECNLRTYVRSKRNPAHNGRPGVWFFSLDAQSRLAVAGARFGFGLPYFYADASCRQVDGRTHFQTARRDRRGPSGTFEASWCTTGPAKIAAAGSFEQFLVERYCLYSQHRGHLVCGEVSHEPWQLAPVDLDLQANDMTQLLNLELAGPPVSALAAKPIHVISWTPSR
ncbi:MAG: hypothetical protein ACJA0V_000492 [Planctomycetota bacterium]|jgi:uncharacterized protein YqjF (DUF2071 family)